MEEKVLFKGKTSFNKLIAFIMILAFIIGIGSFLWSQFPPENYSYFESHVLYEQHNAECYDEVGKGIYSEYSQDPDLTFILEQNGSYPINCKWEDNDFLYFYDFLHLKYPTFLIIGSMIVLVCILISFLIRYKFYITQTNVYGKNCFKKFNIALADIIEVTQKGKGIIILTENSRLKLSPLKNSGKIYNYIKNKPDQTSFTEEKQIIQQLNDNADDIQLF